MVLLLSRVPRRPSAHVDVPASRGGTAVLAAPRAGVGPHESERGRPRGPFPTVRGLFRGREGGDGVLQLALERLRARIGERLVEERLRLAAVAELELGDALEEEEPRALDGAGL